MAGRRSPLPRAILHGALFAGSAVCLPACGTDVAQTAVSIAGTPPPLACPKPETAPALPEEPRFGGGASIEPWVLRTGDYSAGQGPGITVAARDGFRLFVNGHLLATSTTSLEPVFVPLTLLPGDNAVAIVVTAVDGPPAVLARIDELERAYVTRALPTDSAPTWKVSTESGADFSLPSFDDSGWTEALDHGAPDDSPGCDPGSGFPAGDDAHFIGAATAGTAVFRLEWAIAPVGFAAGTTGGGGAEPVVATLDELADLLATDDAKVVLLPEGTLDVRRTGDQVTDTVACPTACPDGEAPARTLNLLDDDETCPVATVPVERLEGRLRVGSNTTLVGLARGAALRGGSLVLDGAKNVILRNLAFYDVNPELIEAGDGIGLGGADGLWVDHATFRLVSDGFVDSTTGSKNLTLSWIKNDGANAAACGGRHPRSNELSDTTATIHHTLWAHVNGRAPLATHAESQIHLYDNVVTDDVDYAVGAACGAEILLESTTFENVKIATGKFTCSDADPGVLGFIRAAGRDNVYGAGRHQAAFVDADEPADQDVFTPIYAYERDPAGTARPLVLERAGAGARWSLPLELR